MKPSAGPRGLGLVQIDPLSAQITFLIEYLTGDKPEHLASPEMRAVINRL